MKIDRKNIEQWADAIDSKGNFPYLISKLVNATASSSAFINIPYGSASYLGGWDGIVESDEGRSFVPAGISLWEFGTDLGPKGKADEDYEKRTADPLGYPQSECTFIFVTPRLWTKKDKWKQAKLDEGIWKDIRVYDSVDLTQWLDNSSAVARWFAVHLGIVPFEGVLTAEQFWLEWSAGPLGKLPPQIITSGRELEMERLTTFLIDIPGIKAVKAKTKTEAMAFIIATAKQLPTDHSDRFFSKTLLVDTDGNYRALHTNANRTPLNLIPKFEDTTPLYAAVLTGHHVIVPLGGDDTYNLELITLPTIVKEGQVEGLVEMGLTRESAERFSKEAGRDIAHLRRLLKFPQNNAVWFKNENLRDIVPALLLGRWNSNNIGDREILEKLSGIPFDNYLEILTRWKNLEDSPLLQIGDTWRLTSPLDLWDSLSGSLTENDFKLLAESFLLIYQNTDNQEDNNDGTIYIIHPFSKPKKYSSWAKEGLIQSLILISQYGDGLKLSKLQKPELWVDVLIDKLLYNATGEQWITLDQKLPLISEASPNSFLKAVYHSLQMEDPTIISMFKSKKGFLGESSNHTGLLWALEGLAWLPEYFYDSTIILLKLSELDPGGNLVNRPSNSLIEIYKPWHFQTLTPFEERMEILKTAVRKEKKEGWKLLTKLLPENHGSASPTHKMRWRLFDKNINLNYTYGEIYATYSVVVDLLLELFDGTDEKLAQLIGHSAIMTSYEDSEKMLSFIEKASSQIPKNSTLARDKTRKILYHHRSYPTADWSLSDDILARYQTLYDTLEPDDIVLKYKWLFDSFHVDFPDGKFREEDDEDQYQKRFKRIEEVRIEALEIIIDTIGLDKAIELANTPDSSRSIGETLAVILQGEAEILAVLCVLKKEEPNLDIVHRFVEIKVIKDGLDWAFEIFKKLQKEGFEDEQLAQFFIPLYPSKELWDFIEHTTNTLKQTYWHSIYPRFYHISVEEKIIGMNYLLYYKRFITAINTAYMIKGDLPTELLTEILHRAATEESLEQNFLREHEVSSLFKTLEKREDLNHEALIKLEWLYLKILGSYGSEYKPKYLHQELAESPEFFIEILKWSYMPKDDKRKEEERKVLSPEALKSFAEQGYQLFNDFKTIPGIQKDNTINPDQLNVWIDAVRQLAEEADRIEMADMQIGKLLAQFSEANKDYWPPDEISEVIERINTKGLKDNFSIAVTNKRGFTSRGPFDGGTIERDNAAHFKKLADLHKFKHPNLSEIFNQIAFGYLQDAKHQDDQAERDRLEY
ncbi:hypothetical protein FNW52_12640 [Flavobacterium sp. ZT3R18]|uniref:hypothetical protein n=1 Tax=Flavobacterium sp. ZT3R18 TaxID=2594429 RepID=UPI00117A7264|nr:hypothetical protein [Flavobacterium sp. ZT3R18]TRX34982.1 hypothetical protein FNW52_12640 [Flavobacterium sp. ZT3R18]